MKQKTCWLEGKHEIQRNSDFKQSEESESVCNGSVAVSWPVTWPGFICLDHFAAERFEFPGAAPNLRGRAQADLASLATWTGCFSNLHY